MITYSFKVGEVRRDEVEGALKSSSRLPLIRAAKRIQREAQRSMKQAPAPGVPSPPGTPPHSQTGTLKGDIQVFVRKLADGSYSVSVGFTRKAWYGIVHERGGKFHPRRAFIDPAWKKESRRIQYHFTDRSFDDAVRLLLSSSRRTRRLTRYD